MQKKHEQRVGITCLCLGLLNVRIAKYEFQIEFICVWCTKNKKTKKKTVAKPEYYFILKSVCKI